MDWPRPASRHFLVSWNRFIIGQSHPVCQFPIIFFLLMLFSVSAFSTLLLLTLQYSLLHTKLQRMFYFSWIIITMSSFEYHPSIHPSIFSINLFNNFCLAIYNVLVCIVCTVFCVLQCSQQYRSFGNIHLVNDFALLCVGPVLLPSLTVAGRHLHLIMRNLMKKRRNRTASMQRVRTPSHDAVPRWGQESVPQCK